MTQTPSLAVETAFWPDTPFDKFALSLAEAHDEVVTEREVGAALAFRAANGIAVSYWQHIAKRALTSLPTSNAAIEEAAKLREALNIVRGSVGDLRKGFARSVDPARWVEQLQSFIDEALSTPTSGEASALLPLSEAEYTTRYIREFAKHISGIDVVNALDCAAAHFADGSGNPEEDAQAEADEWRRAS